jgi:hypothetical protein
VWDSFPDALHPRSGTVEFNINLECLDGPQLLEAKAVATCTGDTQVRTTTANNDNHPTLKLDVIKNADGSSFARIHYGFPNTNNPHDRWLRLEMLLTPTQSGGTIFDELDVTPQSGIRDVPLPAVSSERTIRATAIQCAANYVT